MDEADRLRGDVAELRTLIDSVLDRGDSNLVDACADVLRDRLERLAELEHGNRTN
jgi:hypothetical protein